jgi:hypothetical protein
MAAWMTDDDLLHLISARLDEASVPRLPSAEASAIAAAQRALGFFLPHLYVRLLTEVANGGFGPGYGIIGVPPDGFEDSDLRANLLEAYREGRNSDDRSWRLPDGLLYLCNWGCGQFSYLDCFSSAPRVITDQVVKDGIRYFETAPSLARWLGEWLEGVDIAKEMYETIGHRKGINPFTQSPMMFAGTRMKGPRVDFSDRL